jgi:hypothetical protein
MVDLLVVGGGGGGGSVLNIYGADSSSAGGGGGGGQVYETKILLQNNVNYIVQVGQNAPPGQNGYSSTFIGGAYSYTAVGGGGGQNYPTSNGTAANCGANGAGPAAAAYSDHGTFAMGVPGVSCPLNLPTPGAGFSGGEAYVSYSGDALASGGGGGGAAGNGNGGPGSANSGGAGLEEFTTGTGVYYGGGGGGGTAYPYDNGGGGNGAQGGIGNVGGYGGLSTAETHSTQNPGGSAYPNTGGGGGGGANTYWANHACGANCAGGSGGSGLVAISYPSFMGWSVATGNYISFTAGSNIVYEWLSGSGVFEFQQVTTPTSTPTETQTSTVTPTPIPQCYPYLMSSITWTAANSLSLPLDVGAIGCSTCLNLLAISTNSRDNLSVISSIQIGSSALNMTNDFSGNNNPLVQTGNVQSSTQDTIPMAGPFDSGDYLTAPNSFTSSSNGLTTLSAEGWIYIPSTAAGSNNSDIFGSSSQAETNNFKIQADCGNSTYNVNFFADGTNTNTIGPLSYNTAYYIQYIQPSISSNQTWYGTNLSGISNEHIGVPTAGGINNNSYNYEIGYDGNQAFPGYISNFTFSHVAQIGGIATSPTQVGVLASWINSYPPVYLTPVFQRASDMWHEGVELWSNYGYSLPTTNTPIVITQPSYNTINVDAITFMQFGMSENVPIGNLTITASALNTDYVANTLSPQYSDGTTVAIYSGTKGIKYWPTDFSNISYFHNYGTFQSVDYAPGNVYGGGITYEALEPNPAAVSLQFEIAPAPNGACSPVPTITVSETPTYSTTPSATPTQTMVP